VTAAELFRRMTLPTRFRVFGLRLVPFTVGHARLLDRIELDEINDGASCLLAAKLCSMPAEQSERWICSRFIGLRMLLLAAGRGGMIRSADQVNKAVQVFAQYLDESTRVPVWESRGEGESRSLGTPFAQHLRSVMLSKLGYSPAEVDQTTYLQAMWDYIGYMEAEGAISVDKGLSNEEEASLFAQADALMAKAKEGVLG
jgi:hypothetical protein